MTGHSYQLAFSFFTHILIFLFHFAQPNCKYYSDQWEWMVSWIRAVICDGQGVTRGKWEYFELPFNCTEKLVFRSISSSIAWKSALNLKKKKSVIKRESYFFFFITVCIKSGSLKAVSCFLFSAIFCQWLKFDDRSCF